MWNNQAAPENHLIGVGSTKAGPSSPGSKAGVWAAATASPGLFCCRVKQPLRAAQGLCSKGRRNHLLTSLLGGVKQLHLMSSCSASFEFFAERFLY